MCSESFYNKLTLQMQALDSCLKVYRCEPTSL